jgi:aspartyl protease family protein
LQAAAYRSVLNEPESSRVFFLLPSALIALLQVPRAAELVPTAPATALCAAPPASIARVPALWIAATSQTQAKGDSAAPPADPSTPLELWRAEDGLFYVEGAINGTPVRFVVDTGASMVVLTASDARRARIATDAGTGTVQAETAGGKRTLTRVTLASMQVGGTDAKGASAVVADDGLGVSLLGQSWLAQLASVTIEGDRMRLRP